MIVGIVFGLLMFCLLIFVHELGHLMAAKSVGIRVNEFALGMGPKILSFKRGETAYSLRAFPIGGYCAMEGEDSDSDDPRAFGKKNMAQKALVVVAGAAMNLLLAVIIMSAVAFSFGAPTNVVSSVFEDSPAKNAGLMEGDAILAVNGNNVKAWNDLRNHIQSAENDDIVLSVLRNGQQLDLKTKSYTDGEGQRKIGITPKTEVTVTNLLPAAKSGVNSTVVLGEMIFSQFGMISKGEASVKDFTGPIGIVQIVGEAAKLGFVNLMYLTAFISLSLAIFNMLPLPALDGGRLIFLIIRKVTGKIITDRIEGMVHMVGMVLLLGLMVLVAYQDIGRIFSTG